MKDDFVLVFFCPTGFLREILVRHSEDASQTFFNNTQAHQRLTSRLSLPDWSTNCRRPEGWLGEFQWKSCGVLIFTQNQRRGVDGVSAAWSTLFCWEEATKEKVRRISDASLAQIAAHGDAEREEKYLLLQTTLSL